ncbi:hypothetical protein PUV47_15030 [Pseudovibrio exalbescens]|uniref:hypothetical protein n=1 Tax=Pseudovibrio exalbescens TaxID=197461 RepID=UPI002365A2CC|nr:hypothetical protein [Pseudovibrio exalbescens]MDD7911241.1 hypothetical protein [Pseudovibrio exalbescens]
MYRPIFSLCLLGAALFASSIPHLANAQDRSVNEERISFQQGAFGAEIRGTIKGAEIKDYLIGVEGGQILTVTMKSDSAASYFNVIPPSESDAATFIGSTSGERYRGLLAEGGDYTIRVYMMRSAARRDEEANYAIDVAVRSEGVSAQGPGATDALIPNTLFHARGELRCAIATAPDVNRCSFGVIRRGEGSATIVVTKPDLTTRGLYFEKGNFTRADDFNPMNAEEVRQATREGDETIVQLGQDRFVIYDAILFGG